MPTRIPEHIRLAVRSMYVIHARPPSEIARSLALTAPQVSNMIAREGWARLRAKKQNEREQKAVAIQDTRADHDVARVVETTAVLSEELGIRSLNFSSELLDAKDPKGLQMASGAALNFVKIARMSRGLDARAGGNERSDVNVNLYIVRGETVNRSEPRNVTPAVVPIPIQT
jgi:hypothetical protein